MTAFKGHPDIPMSVSLVGTFSLLSGVTPEKKKEIRDNDRLSLVDYTEQVFYFCLLVDGFFFLINILQRIIR